MILSSADILEILGRNEVIRLSATVSIVDGKPGLTGAEGVRIYVDRSPRVDEFQATWFIYIESDEDIDLIVAELQRLLPSVRVSSGLLTTVTTTDFLLDSTQKAPETLKAQAAQLDLTQYEERFQRLAEDVQDRMLLVTSGRPGKDGLPGPAGRDGRDMDATQVKLFDLKDVSQSALPLTSGQVLTWNGEMWTNLHVAKSFHVGGNVGSQVKFLNDLRDVTIEPELLKKDFGLVYDGSEWVVASPPVLAEGHNQTGSTILKGTPVCVVGTHNSGKPLFAPADASGSGNSPAIGLLDEDMADGSDGCVVLSGIIHNVDTSSYLSGQALYLSQNPGVLTNTRPTAAQYEVQKVGIVTRSHASAGDILVIGAGRVNDVPNEIEIEGDIEITDSLAGLILKSPNGTRYRISVDDSGNLSTSPA